MELEGGIWSQPLIVASRTQRLTSRLEEIRLVTNLSRMISCFLVNTRQLLTRYLPLSPLHNIAYSVSSNVSIQNHSSALIHLCHIFEAGRPDRVLYHRGEEGSTLTFSQFLSATIGPPVALVSAPRQIPSSSPDLPPPNLRPTMVVPVDVAESTTRSGWVRRETYKM